MNISLMVLRVVFVINLILGIVFWTGNGPAGLVLIHMLLGIIFVALLWVVGTMAALRTGSIGVQVSTFVTGLIIAIVGLAQGGILEGSAHVVIQIIHLLLAVIGIGLAEMASARVRRKATAKPA